MVQHPLLFALTVVLSLLSSCHQKEKSRYSGNTDNQLHKLEYNNPGLLVDLDVGFKSVPMPMDFDGDGDYDLLISESGAYVEAGIFYFENISGDVDMPVFRRGMKLSFERRRLGADGNLFEVAQVDGHVHVLTPDRVNERLLIYKDVPQNVFWDGNELPLPEEGYDYLHNFKTSQWKLIDFDGDGLHDLICAARGYRPKSYRGRVANLLLNTPDIQDKNNPLLFFKNIGTNELPEFEKAAAIVKEDGTSLAADLAIKPMLADFDHDGDMDLIGIGKPENGDEFQVDWQRNFMLYFENSGSKSSYRYTTGKVMTYNNLPVRMESRSTIHTVAIDWNKDGYVDIIAGEESGRVSFLKNTGELINGVPHFLPPRFLQQEAKYVDFGALVAPRVFDWDGDGLDDILSGNEMGYIGFIKNLGGNIPTWDSPKLLEIDGTPIRLIKNEALPNTEDPIWGYTTLDVGNWDEDDLPDLLVNEHNGNIVFLKNIGTGKDPKLAAPKPLEVQWKGAPQKPAWVPGTSAGDELLAPWRTSPFIMDFDDDGLNDLVMLDYEGYLAVYKRYKEKDRLLLAHPERNFIFPSEEPIQLNQLTGKSSGRLKITFADWDGDGLEDLIVASKPAVDWMKNKGMRNGKMVLQYMGRVASRTLMGHTDGPVVSDWNADGIPDLLVGTESGVFYYWQRSSIDITTTMTTTEKQTPANYRYFKR